MPGSNVKKTTTPSNPLFYAAKSSVDSFEVDYQDYYNACAEVMIALGVASLTWETIVGALAGGTAAAIAAAHAIDAFNDCDGDVGDAYMYVSNF